MEWIKSVWDSGVPITLFTGVVVPIGAVLLSVYVTNKRAENKESQDERNQRIKLLNMLRHELVTLHAHYDIKGKYYTKESLTAKLIINSPSFNVDDHRVLLNLLWEYLKGYDSLNTAIDSIPMLYGPEQTVLLDFSRGISGFYNLREYKKLAVEMQVEIDSIIDGAAQDIINAAKPLLEEVEKQIQKSEEN